MKPVHGLVLAFSLLSVVFAGMTAWSLWHMAGLYDRIHNLESLPAKTGVSRNEIREPQQAAKNDQLRSFTADEANEWLKHCEDTPENRKRWAEAGTPMMEIGNKAANKAKSGKVWKRVREPVQLEGGIDDGYELVEE
jgi:hypothetical protein